MSVIVGLSILLAVSDPSAIQKVGEALVAGSLAGDQRARAAAAKTIAAFGAMPADGQEDLGVAWRGRERAAPAYRDRIMGPVYRGLTLDPGAAARFEQSFYAGQTARVAVVAVDRAPVAIQVVDDEGRERCTPAQTTCEWVPSWTARVRVEVQNKGDRRGRFFLVIH